MSTPPHVAIVGGGPAGLIAAETLARSGHRVTVFDRMPTVGRKFLMAGRGGLNLTHSEPFDAFVDRYGEAAPWMRPMLDAFPPTALREWCHGLGIPTFVGSSGRVFPEGLKASPLLRAWLRRLGDIGVAIRTRHHWLGFDDTGRPIVRGPEGEATVDADATILALGGASWPRLGGDGGWAPILAARGVAIAPLEAANAGWRIDWSPHVRRFAGTPLKRIAISHGDRTVRGEAILTEGGIEGGPVYALGPAVRAAIRAEGTAQVTLDLRPDLDLPAVEARLLAHRGAASTATLLAGALKLSGPALTLIREAAGAEALSTPRRLAAALKALPLTVRAIAPIDRAISTAGGITRDAVDGGLMLRALPGVFACGEMLDWEAPTGGYLLQGCFATGVAAAAGVSSWLAHR